MYKSDHSCVKPVMVLCVHICCTKVNRMAASAREMHTQARLQAAHRRVESTL